MPIICRQAFFKCPFGQTQAFYPLIGVCMRNTGSVWSVHMCRLVCAFSSCCTCTRQFVFAHRILVLVAYMQCPHDIRCSYTQNTEVVEGSSQRTFSCYICLAESSMTRSLFCLCVFSYMHIRICDKYHNTNITLSILTWGIQKVCTEE